MAEFIHIVRATIPEKAIDLPVAYVSPLQAFKRAQLESESGRLVYLESVPYAKEAE